MAKKGEQVVNKLGLIKTVESCFKGKYTFADGTTGGVAGWKTVKDGGEIQKEKVHIKEKDVLSKNEVVTQLVKDRSKANQALKLVTSTNAEDLTNNEILMAALAVIDKVVECIMERENKEDD